MITTFLAALKNTLKKNFCELLFLYWEKYLLSGDLKKRK
jgi:hypothetical protein